MQRGIVVEVKRRNAIILTKDGTIQKIKLAKKHYPIVGEEMLIRPSEPQYKIHYVLFPFLFLFFILTLVEETDAPEFNPVVAYVNFFGPGSVEVGVDENWNVVTVHAYDQIGSEVIRMLPNQPTLDDLSVQFSHYTTDQSNLLIATTMTRQEQEPLLREKLQMIDEREQNMMFTIHSLHKEKRKEAFMKGLSPGKYVVFLENEKYSPIMLGKSQQDDSKKNQNLLHSIHSLKDSLRSNEQFVTTNIE